MTEAQLRLIAAKVRRHGEAVAKAAAYNGAYCHEGNDIVNQITTGRFTNLILIQSANRRNTPNALRISKYRRT